MIWRYVMYKKIMKLSSDNETDLFRTLELVSVPFKDILISLNEQGLWYQSKGYKFDVIINALKESEDVGYMIDGEDEVPEYASRISMIISPDNKSVYLMVAGVDSFRIWWDVKPSEVRLPCEDPYPDEIDNRNWRWDNDCQWVLYNINVEWISFTGGISFIKENSNDEDAE